MIPFGAWRLALGVRCLALGVRRYHTTNKAVDAVQSSEYKGLTCSTDA